MNQSLFKTVPGLIFMAICFICLIPGFSTKNSGEQDCESDCLLPYPEKCLKKSKGSDSYFYDLKTLKCYLASNCVSPKFYSNKDTLKECEDSCGYCTTLLKHYKPNDPCLEMPDYEAGNSTKPYAKSTKFWVFTKGYGECAELDLALKDPPKEDMKFLAGLWFNTKIDCDKKCPPV